MSYSSSSLDVSADVVGYYDTFDLFRYMQEQAMTVTTAIVYNGDKPDVVVYPDRDIRVNVPDGYKTVLSVEYVPYNAIYKAQYKYTEEEI